MSLTFKLASLAIRTAAKPIGNYIKRQAKEHDGFRRFAINQAQRVHRIDMRMRLGILHDADAQERMHERERRAADERKRKEESPTVRTAEEQKKHDEQKTREEKTEKEGGSKKKEEKSSRVKIRPLSDARAIELGANFFSEAFIFGVAVALLLLENWRSRSKASNRRDEVAERLAILEDDVERLKKEHDLPEIVELQQRIKKTRESKERYSWFNPAGWWRRTEMSDGDEVGEGVPGEVDGSNGSPIPGNVPGPSPEKAVKPHSPAVTESTQSSAQANHNRTGQTQTPDRLDHVSAVKKER